LSTLPGSASDEELRLDAPAEAAFGKEKSPDTPVLAV
jgi:hypothetical protein